MQSILYIGILMLQLASPLVTVDEHAIYLSTIEISEEESLLNLEVKVFEDDLRDALRNFHQTIIDPSLDLFQNQVEEYFQSHILIFVDSNQLTSKLSSLILVGDSYQVRFTIPNASSSSILDLEVSYFYELFPTQQNVLNLDIRNTKKYHIFRNGNRKKTFNLGK